MNKIVETVVNRDNLVSQYTTLFASNTAHGTADNISKKGCLALVKLGYEVWNKWREDYPVIVNGSDEPVNFADFGEAVFEIVDANFQNFRFGSHCSFKDATFEFAANFTNAEFGERTNFNGARFGTQSKLHREKYNTYFNGGIFGRHCTFVGSEFYGSAIFNAAKLECTKFWNAKFCSSANFTDAILYECTFSNVAFATLDGQVYFNRSQWTSCSFASVEFKNAVFFYGALFNSRVIFEKTTFKSHVFFFGTNFFGTSFEFNEVTFELNTTFNGCTWNGDVQFKMVRGKHAEFICNTWHGVFDGNSSNWSEKVTFISNVFKSSFEFQGAQAYGIDFTNDVFEDYANFSGMTEDEISNHSDTVYHSDTAYHELISEFSKNHGLSTSKFYEVSFKGCQFKKKVNFKNREFCNHAFWLKSEPKKLNKYVKNEECENEKIIVLEPTCESITLEARETVFDVPPIFHGSKLPQDSSFNGAKFPEKPSGEEWYERSYRTLKWACAQHGATREEQRFFKLEMAAEEARLKHTKTGFCFENGRYFLLCVYRWLGYGLSSAKPLFFLFIVLLLMIGLLICLNQLTWDFSWDGSKNLASVVSCAASKVLPTPFTSDAKVCDFLTIHSIPIISELVKLLGLVLTFLIGLGLRNHLKIK